MCTEIGKIACALSVNSLQHLYQFKDIKMEIKFSYFEYYTSIIIYCNEFNHNASRITCNTNNMNEKNSQQKS